MSDTLFPPEDSKMEEVEILKSEELKVEFPYNLNNLFNMNYSFDTLKKSIEYLAKQ